MTARTFKSLVVAEAAKKLELSATVHQSDIAGIDAPFFGEMMQRNDRLAHGSMSSGGSDIAERILQDSAGGTDVADVANGHNVVLLVDTTDESPLNTLKGEAEVGHLWNEIVALDAAQMDERDFADHPPVFQREA